MPKFQKIDIPFFVDFSKPVMVDNRNFRKGNTDKYFEMSKKEVSNFPKEDGLIVSEDYVHFLLCPVCNSNKDKQLFIKWGFQISVCTECDHIYVKNQLLESRIIELYTTSDVDKQFQTRRNDDEGLNRYWILVYAKYIQKFQDTAKKNNSYLLDIGAGAGQFLSLCSELTNFKLHAMEFSENSAEFLKSIVGAKNFYQEKISSTDFHETKFDIITMFGVLEHISEPRVELGKCKKILNEDGKILVLVPNFYSRAYKILGINTPTINPRTHLNYFSKKSMDRLCSEVGLKVQEYYQELPVIDLMYDFISFNDQIVDEILQDNESYYSVFIISHNDL